MILDANRRLQRGLRSSESPLGYEIPAFFPGEMISTSSTTRLVSSTCTPGIVLHRIQESYMEIGLLAIHVRQDRVVVGWSLEEGD